MLGLEVELELAGKELPLGRGVLQHCTGVSKRGVLLLADCEPPPACAEEPSRQAACLRLPPPSFPRNLNPARLDPGSPLGGEAPAFF